MKSSDKVTMVRFLFGILMVLSAIFRNIYAFLAFYILAVLSDISDGFLARKLNESTESGKKLDILADNFIVLCLIISFYLLKKEILISYRWHILALLGYFFLVQYISYSTKKRLLFMRTVSANIAAIFFPIVVLGFIVMDARILAYIYIIMMYYSLTEKLFMSLFNLNAISIFLIKRLRIKGFFILMITIIIALALYIPITHENKVCFSDSYCVDVEIRNTPEGRELGLMYRDSLAENAGMLFIFDGNVGYAFWMENMKIPIDIIFISKDKKIVSISQDAKPCEKPSNECELYYPAGEYMYVVETAANFSSRHNLSAGQEVKFFVN